VAAGKRGAQQTSYTTTWYRIVKPSILNDASGRHYVSRYWLEELRMFPRRIGGGIIRWRFIGVILLRVGAGPYYYICECGSFWTRLPDVAGLAYQIDF
jgi:hypothetical protein